MTTPVTLKEEKFLGLPKENYAKILNDDYIHAGNAIETLKFKQVSLSGSVINYKTSCHLEEKGIISQDELKLLIPYKQYFFQTRLDRKGNIKKHIEFGEYNNVFFYMQFKHNFNYDNVWSRLGAFHFGKNTQTGARVEKDTKGTPFFAFRHVQKFENAQFGCVSIFDFSKLLFSKFDTSFSYFHKDTQIALTHLADSINIGTIKLGLSHKLNDKNTFAAQISKNLANSSDANIELGVISSCNKNLTSKFKINNLLKLSLSSKYQVDKLITVTVSGEIALNKGQKMLDFKKVLFTPFGFQIDLNF